VTWSENDVPSGRRPFLSRLSINPDTAGRWTIQMLIDVVEGKSPQPPNRIVPSQLFKYASTGSGEYD